MRPRPLWVPTGAELAALPAPCAYDFRVGAPDPQLFPLAAWRRCVARELRPAAVFAHGADEAGGHPGLRRAIARHIGVSRAVRAAADDVLVTHGTQQALDLIGRVLLEPGACVAVEEPGYGRVRQLFARLGARVVGVPVDAEGIDVSAIPRAARLVYVTPSHQFPLGVAMSLERRLALLAWANRHRAVVVEDDYDSEFRFEGRPLDPLQCLDRDGRVIYVGSFSKVMRPVVRLGFLVAPASLQPALRSAKLLTDSSGVLPTQAALARFIDEGLMATHIRKAAREYAGRHARIVDVLHRDFARWLEVVPSSAGLHVSARVVGGRVDRSAARRGSRAGCGRPCLPALALLRRATRTGGARHRLRSDSVVEDRRRPETAARMLRQELQIADRKSQIGGRNVDSNLHSAICNLQCQSGVAEHGRGIDARRAVGGEPAGERADGAEDDGGADQRERIARLEAVEQRRDELRRPRADARADDDADPDEQRHSREDESDDAAGRGAERHADPDLRPAAADTAYDVTP